MINLIDEIQEILSYDDIDEDVKLERINELCNQENTNYNNLISRVRLLEGKIAKLRGKL